MYHKTRLNNNRSPKRESKRYVNNNLHRVVCEVLICSKVTISYLTFLNLNLTCYGNGLLTAYYTAILRPKLDYLQFKSAGRETTKPCTYLILFMYMYRAHN